MNRQRDAGPPWCVVAFDDEPPALKAFRRLLDGVPDFVLAATSSDPFAAETLLRECDPDVVVLDVHMPGRTGFDVARAIGTAASDARAPLLVFVTAYDRFAIEAFEAHAIDYLLKPVDPVRFADTLQRLRARLHDRAARDVGPRLEALLRQLAQTSGPAAMASEPSPSPSAMPPRLAVRDGGRTTLLDPRLIDRIDSDDNDVVISAGARRIRVRETLTAMAERLPAGQFLRISRSCVVNVHRIQQIEPYFHGDVVLHLANGTTATSGRSYRERVRTTLGIATR